MIQENNILDKSQNNNKVTLTKKVRREKKGKTNKNLYYRKVTYLHKVTRSTEDISRPTFAKKNEKYLLRTIIITPRLKSN